MESRSTKRWLCNELVCEFCLAIPLEKTQEQIMLTSSKMYAYLEPLFSKRFGDAIAFLKSKLGNRNNKQIEIWIDQVAQNSESKNTVISQEQSEDEFTLKTNQFRVRMRMNKEDSRAAVYCRIDDAKHGNDHLCHFMRIIAPLIKPSVLNMCFCSYRNAPNAKLVAFISSGYIDSIKISGIDLSVAPIEVLTKIEKLKIDKLYADEVPQFIRWLTTNNDNGQMKKCLIDCWFQPTLLFDKIKRNFMRATSKSPFVVQLISDLCDPLNEFTLRNEASGEGLKLRSTNANDGCGSSGNRCYTLSRFPIEELENSENECFEFCKPTMTRIYWRWR